MRSVAIKVSDLLDIILIGCLGRKTSTHYTDIDVICPILCFRKSLLAWRFIQRSKLTNFCHDLMQNRLSVNTYARKKFYSNHMFLKQSNISLFQVVEMNANYEEICRVGNLSQIFNKFWLFIFLKFSEYCENQSF